MKNEQLLYCPDLEMGVWFDWVPGSHTIEAGYKNSDGSLKWVSAHTYYTLKTADDFLQECKKLIIAFDWENCDRFRFRGFLKPILENLVRVTSNSREGAYSSFKYEYRVSNSEMDILEYAEQDWNRWILEDIEYILDLDWSDEYSAYLVSSKLDRDNAIFTIFFSKNKKFCSV